VPRKAGFAETLHHGRSDYPAPVLLCATLHVDLDDGWAEKKAHRRMIAEPFLLCLTVPTADPSFGLPPLAEVRRATVPSSELPVILLRGYSEGHPLLLAAKFSLISKYLGPRLDLAFPH
jgi:hypothetical protein